MCTAAFYKTNDLYFGRNLDFDGTPGESVVITPRGYRFAWRSPELNEFLHDGMSAVKPEGCFGGSSERALTAASSKNLTGTSGEPVTGMSGEPVTGVSGKAMTSVSGEAMTGVSGKTKTGVSGHYAMIGVAHILYDYPLYYDAVNEKGLCAAGLNLVRSAVWFPPRRGKLNIAQFELIPWLLSGCASVAEIRERVPLMNITGESFSPELPAAKLHWMFADRNECAVLEQTSAGLTLYDDPAGVLTNEPPFPVQMFSLNDFAGVSAKPPEVNFGLPLEIYSRGMGGIGLPGDFSSRSRFVKAAFVRANSVSGDCEDESVAQLFHILESVAQPRGCCALGNGAQEYTLYTGCVNAYKGIYYLKTYDSLAAERFDLHAERLDGDRLIVYTP